jgi:hypothetical protein
MLFVSSTISKKIKVLGLVWLCGITLAKAQTENSPYSRYGLGDIVPSQNIITRGMGGISSAYSDFQSVNFANPASYARLKATTLDVGLDFTSRTLRSTNPPSKFSAYSPNISYLQLGIPLLKNRNWGMNLGLRPVTKISYKISRGERLNTGTLNDSVSTIFEGNGGGYEVFAGTGFSIGKFRIGANVGYLFGSKDYSTRRTFINDSVLYYASNHETQANYGGLMVDGGIQYSTKIGKKMSLHLGVNGSLQQNLSGSQDKIRETFAFNSNTGGTDSIDVVDRETDISGKVKYPASYGFGVILSRDAKWIIGADYQKTLWSDYRFFGEKDLTRDSWKASFGGQIIPDALTGKTYFSRVAYRAGFNFGKDYVSVDKELPVYSITLGTGLPMRRPMYTNQASVINIGLEFGRRGNKDNLIRESFFRFAIGLNLSDIWFIKRKYQ